MVSTPDGEALMAEYVESLRYEADITDVKRKLGELRDVTESTQKDHSSRVGLMSKAWDGFHSVTSRAIDVVQRVGVVAGAALGAAGVFGVKAAGDFQQTRIAFEGILGSGQKAQAFLSQLRDFAAKTPFEFPELSGAARQLLGVGFAAKDVIPIMTKIGNVTAALGGSAEGVNGVVRALGQMQGKGKASAEELQQISEAIPGFSAIKAIAESMGVTTAEAFKLLEKGAVPADEAIQAILTGMEKFPGAAGAMDRQSRTLNGVISTLKDTFRNALVDGIEPFLPGISRGLEGAMPKIQGAVQASVRFVGNLIAQVRNLVEMFRSGDADGQGFAEIIDNIFGNTGRLIPIFRTAWNVVSDLVAAFRSIASFVRGNLTPILVGLGVIVGAVLVGQVIALATAFAALFSPAVLIVGAIAAVAAGLVYAYQHFETFREVVDAVGRFLKDTLVPAVQSAAEVVVDRFGWVVDWVQRTWPQVSEVIDHVMNVVAGVIRTVVDVVSALWRAWGDDIVRIVKVAWDFVRETVNNALQVISGIIRTAVAVINGDWGQAWDAIKSVLSAAWDQIENVVSTSVGVLRATVGGIVSTFGEVLRPLGNFLHTWIVVPFETVVAFIGGLPARISAVAGGMFDGIKEAFKSAINWIIRGWNSLDFSIPGFDPPGPGPKFAGFSPGLPNIPELRGWGGPVTAAKPYIVGDRGRPELFVPKLNGTIHPDANQVLDQLSRSGGAGQGPSPGVMVAEGAVQVSVSAGSSLSDYDLVRLEQMARDAGRAALEQAVWSN